MIKLKLETKENLLNNFSNVNKRINQLVLDLIKSDIKFYTIEVANVVNELNGNTTYIRDCVLFEYNNQCVFIQVAGDENKLSIFRQRYTGNRNVSDYLGDRINLNNIKRLLDRQEQNNIDCFQVLTSFEDKHRVISYTGLKG